jgi:hypothetical protein
MSKFCKALGRRVVYLECLECENRVCEDRVCEKPQVTILPKKSKPIEVVGEEKVTNPGAPKSATECAECNDGNHPACETCCHMIDQRQDHLFGKEMLITSCEVHRNYLIDSSKVAREGCEYHNRDMSNEKICMNCESYLGGGDWGLACSEDYHKLPKALSPACDEFKKK